MTDDLIEHNQTVVVTILSRESADRLHAAPFTYPDVGRTAGQLPAGYRITKAVRTLPADTDFEDAARALLSWQVHLRAGFRVAASDPYVTSAAVVRLSLGAGRLALVAPCRVIFVAHDGNRRGFAYGTLPGHPECGEESFMLDRGEGTITFTVTAFSRPASLLAKLVGPLGECLQDVVTRRYLRAIWPR